MNEYIDKNCESCRYHDVDNAEWDAYICVNGNSPYYCEWTGNDDICDEWEIKDDM